MNRLISIPILIALFVLPIRTEPWGGKTITSTSATAKRIVSLRTMASSVFVQMTPTTGPGGLGYILYAPPDVTCVLNGSGTTLIAVLAAATATAPGGNATVPSNSDPQGGIDVRGYCVQGSADGDPILTSWNLRN